VVESNNQIQSQRDYLPLLDLSINQTKQQTSTLHIGTHILSENNKDNAQTQYTNSDHQPHPLNQGLSISLAKGLGT
jgi:hypothetical protein